MIETFDINLLEVILISLLILSTGWMLIVLWYRDKQKLQETQALMLVQANYEHMLLSTQLEIHAQACRHITHEIYDHIGQNLSLAKLRLTQQALDHADCDTAEPKALIASSIKKLRCIAKSIDPDCTQVINLEKSIRHELGFIEDDGMLQTSLEITGKYKHIEKDKNIVLFRLFQEIANNTVAHASANTLQVSLLYGSDSLKCIIKDDGKGFAVLAAEQKGVTRLHQKAALISANIDIKSMPGKGTIVHIEVPY